MRHQRIPARLVALADVPLHPDWMLKEDGLTRHLVFPNLRACGAFISALMEAANMANHHPDVTNDNCDVTVRFVTHSAGNTVTEKDYAGARQADLLVQEAMQLTYRKRLALASPVDVVGRFPVVSTSTHGPAIRARDLFNAPVAPLMFPLNRKTAENAVEVLPLSLPFEPTHDVIPVAGLSAYVDRPRKDPPDVVHLVLRDGRERWLIQEGHTRLAAAKARGDTEMSVRVWQFMESDRGTYDPVPRGLHRMPHGQRGFGYRVKLEALVAGRLDLEGNEHSGNYGHGGRPGQVGGSAPGDGGGEGGGKEGGDTSAAARGRTPEQIAKDIKEHKALKKEWAVINRAVLKHVEKGTPPDDPGINKLMDQQRGLVKQIHRLDLDPGGVEGIGLPGEPRDIVIIGSGPAGMMTAINASYEGLDTLLIDAQKTPGGQAKHSSRVENYGGFPAGVSGERLAESMHSQATRLGTEAMLGVSVTNIEHDPESRLNTVTLSDGQQIKARTVVMAGGVTFRKLNPTDVPGADAHGIHTGDGKSLKADAEGKVAMVLGASNGAAQAVLGIADGASKVYLVARRPLTETMSKNQIEALQAWQDDGRVQVIEGDEIAKVVKDNRGHVTAVHLKNQTEPIKTDTLGVFIGGDVDVAKLPKGIKTTRERDQETKAVTEAEERAGFPAPQPKKGEKRPPNKIVVDKNQMTSIPGVFAAGDIREGTIGRIAAAGTDGQQAQVNAYSYLVNELYKEQDVEEKRSRLVSKPDLSVQHAPGVLHLAEAEKKPKPRPRRQGMTDEEFDALVDELFDLDKEHPWLGQTVEPVDDDLQTLQVSAAMTYREKLVFLLGGQGSGNFGHAGRPGERGGSSSEGGDGGTGKGGGVGVAEAPSSGGIPPGVGHGDTVSVPPDASPDLGTSKPKPIKTESIGEAVDLILKGQVVELEDVSDVATVIETLAAMAVDAESRGEKDAIKYDLCNVSVPGTNLFCGSPLKTEKHPNGVPRIAMPQLAGKPVPGSQAAKLTTNKKGEVDATKLFRAHLESVGATTKDEVVPAASLKATQADMVGENVAWMMTNDVGFKPDDEAIYVSSDNYVLDGHHRWAAVVGQDAKDGTLGESTMKIVRVDRPIAELVHRANNWATDFGIAPKAASKKLREAIARLAMMLNVKPAQPCGCD